MKINCETARVRGRVPTIYDAPELRVVCGKPAVMLIVTNYDDDLGTGLIAHPACAEHAPEEVHEARSSMSEDEYAVVNLPPPGLRHRLVRESAALTEEVRS